MDRLVKTVRKARNVGVANKIEGIKAIRKAYPEHDLIDAKEFFELVTGDWSHVAAVNMNALWCAEHWGDRLDCKCSTDTVWCKGCDRPLAGYTFEQRKQHYNECNGYSSKAQAATGSTTSGQLMSAWTRSTMPGRWRRSKRSTPRKRWSPKLRP